MLKKALENLPVTTIFIAYLYLCGGLYLVAYWSVFDIDVFSLVSLSEIPKSFIFPFIVSQGFFLLYSLTEYSTKMEYINFDSQSTFWFFWKQPNSYLVLCMVVSSFLLIFPETIFLWVSAGALLAFGGILKFITDGYISGVIQDFHLRKYLATIIVLTPITCFMLGKLKSIQVRKNVNIKYTRIINAATNSDMRAANDSMRLKLLGFLGEKAIVSTLDNEKIYILSQSAVDVFEIEVSGRK